MLYTNGFSKLTMDKIIFCGDLVCPFDVDVDYSDICSLFERSVGIANLEGAILLNKSAVEAPKWTDKYSLYSSPQVLDIIKKLNIKYVSLCNNHILDYKQDINETVELLKSNDIDSWGLKNHDLLKIKFNGHNLHIITLATFSNEHSLNLMNPSRVLSDIRRIRRHDPDALILIYPHWGVEKFYYPEPADRKFAHDCVDAGANIVVGHHPHVIQPVEIYKGVPIVYSLGNFILPQTFYGNKKLVYRQPEVQHELIVEWDGKNIQLYQLYFDKETNKLKVDLSADIEKHFALFKEQISGSKYLLSYLKNASLLDIALRTRYVPNIFNEYISYVSRNLLRFVRKVLIRAGLHNPYKAFVK